MYLTLRDPFQGFDYLDHEFLKNGFRHRSGTENSNWSPEVELIELADNYELKMELPGIDPKTVKVEIKEDVLTISGDKATIHSHDEKKVAYVEETRFGKFRRSFKLKSIDNKKIAASSKFGVLTLRIPKKEESRTQSIPIDIS